MTSERHLDRTRPPAGSTARTSRFPSFQRSEPAAGLQVLAMAAPRQPLVSLDLLAPGGTSLEPRGGAGLATFAASMLDEGTRSRTSPEIAALVEGLGADLTVGADRDFTYLSITLLAEHTGVGLELLHELLTEATFPPEEIERRRRQRLTTLLRRRDQPGTVADERFSAALFGDGPYGRPILGTRDTVRDFDRAAIHRFHQRNHQTGDLHLIAAGDLDPQQVRKHALDLFAGRDSIRSTLPPSIPPSAIEGIEIHLIDRPQAAQTELRIGHVGIERTHPDRVPARVMNSILGGKFSSRINLNLRERHGFTYGASSRFTSGRAAGPFVVSAAVETEHAGSASREVLAELRRIQVEPVVDEELEDARNFLIGSFAYSLQTVESLAGKLAEIALHDLPSDHYARSQEAVREVDFEAVQRVARQLLRPANLVIVAVAPIELLRPQFENLGRLRKWTVGGQEEML